jgi:hypothetical protein
MRMMGRIRVKPEATTVQTRSTNRPYSACQMTGSSRRGK